MTQVKNLQPLPKKHAKRRRYLWLLLTLLLLVGVLMLVDYLQNTRASTITIDLPLSEDVQDFVEDLASQGAEFRNSIDESESAPGTVIPSGSTATDTSSDQGGTSGTPAVPSADSVDSGTPSPSTTGGTGGGEGVTGSNTPSGGTTTGGGTTGGSGEGTTGGTGGTGRGGGGAGNTGGSGGGSVGEGDEDGSSSNLVVTVKLVRNDGLAIYPAYHFTDDTAQLVFDERKFRPGMYTLVITSTNTISGESSDVSQEFAWGVLAMNTDKDVYRPNETAEIHIGVLDEHGAIVCDASLTLTITDPFERTTTLRTSDNSIEITGTCGQKQPGFIAPDYRTQYTFIEEGEYQLALTSVTDELTTSLDSAVQVTSSPSLLVKREAATRLWPFALSTMDIQIEFLEAFSGSIVEVLPDGFQIENGEWKIENGSSHSLGTSYLQYNSSSDDEEYLTLSGVTALAGETLILSYSYDAPDVSPEFYLVGPLQFATSLQGNDVETDRRSVSTAREQRAWQIANDDPGQTNNYEFEADVIASGGGEDAKSSNYVLSDTIGEPGVGASQSNNYKLDAGYRGMGSNFLSLTCFTALDLGSIPGVGQADAAANCTVIADNEGGYTLSWQVPTGSGGVSTGYMISQHNNTIDPFSPAVVNVPETWSIASTVAEWGGRLKSASTDTDVKWGTDTTDEKWLNVASGSSIPVVSRSSRTSPTGSIEQFEFRAEVGNSKTQEAGTYDVTVDFILIES